MAAGIPAKVMADRLGHSSVMLTLDTYSHVTPAMDHAAADLIAGLVPSAAELPLASCEPRAEGQDPGQEEKRQKARSDGVGRRGIEPRTRGLKVSGAPSGAIRTSCNRCAYLRLRCSLSASGPLDQGPYGDVA